MQSNVKSLCSSPVQDYLKELHSDFSRITEGKVATYIPELAKADPGWFGICLVTLNGAVYEIGDSAQPFTIQSISKPFVYGLAAGGTAGVERAVRLLEGELRRSLALLGATSVGQLDRSFIRPRSGAIPAGPERGAGNGPDGRKPMVEGQEVGVQGNRRQ